MTVSNFSARLMFVMVLLVAGQGLAEPKKDKDPAFECPKLSKKLSAEEVFAGRMEALLAGNLDLAFCYYAEDAVIVLPGSVVQGREQVRIAFTNFGSVFGGVIPQPSSVTISGEIVLATFSLDTPHASVQDGADTFVIRDGRIQAQTVHASIVFHAP
ncbi:nuclear transport factor 2 family protein [Archangium violaceum]|uniref:nuclear transport factor 2 family protein n=1 Tax=Archangium violaceum TaxID=83451 RepID=UPI00193BAD0C|nr:nuclear transport factor 2 family protein [Archangium violaceum]QRK05040.1 nuclear transport factor 2 family protein [Archangium violaceum]